MPEKKPQEDIAFDYKFGFSKRDTSVAGTGRGLSADTVREISRIKGEPEWMTVERLKAYDIFVSKKMPEWGADLSRIDFDAITYYKRPTDAQVNSWEDLPPEIKDTYDAIGVPEAEKNFLAGVSAQYDSEVVYESVTKVLAEQGVIFCDMDTGLRKYPEVVKEYFGTLIPSADNKFAALNTATWSGGSFVYVPKGVKVKLPLQAYFRINAERFGQFERTLIIADEGSDVHYIEGCLPAGEQILLADRWVNIESVNPDDRVLNSDGQSARVKSVRKRRYRGKMITISPISSGNEFRLTPEHPVLVIPRDEVLTKRRQRKTNWRPEVNTKILLQTKPRFIEAGKLREGDFLVFPISQETKDDKYFSTAVMRLLGFYLAEGSTFVHKQLKQPIVSFSFGMDERAHIEEVKHLIREITGKNSYEQFHKKNHGISVTCYSATLRELCLQHCGKGAATKALSKTLMNLPPQKQASLLETYFLGDGSVYERKHRMIRAATASQQLARQLQMLIARQGHYATMSLRPGGPDVILGRKILRKDQYILYYSPDKQQSEIRRHGNVFLVPIKKIGHKQYDGSVFNIELYHAPNAYLTRGFATHNCTAPIYTTDSIHSAVVEIFVKKNARVRYTTVQNWSKNVYNLVTKRARADEGAAMEWIDCNIGSQVTMKYPSVYLMGEGSRGEVLSIAFAGRGQHQDAGAKMIHFAPKTTSRIVSKSISKDGGRTSYRGLVQVMPGAKQSAAYVSCDALLLDEASRSDTYPTMKIKENDTEMQHEATVEKIGEEKLFYLTSRGIPKGEAEGMLVNGFIEPVAKEIPLEYSIELNRLINLEMSGSVG